MYKPETLDEIKKQVDEFGVDTVASLRGIGRESVRRAVRLWKNANEEQEAEPIDDNLTRQIRDRFSDHWRWL